MEPEIVYTTPYTVMNAVIMALVSGLILIIPLWRIFRRAGFHPAWSLMVFLPYIGLFTALFVLAFARWPADALPGEVE